MSKGKILVIRGGAIGDFILTLPAITALRKQFPKAHLEVLGYPHIVQLALAGGLVNRVQPIEARGLAGFFARGGELAPDLVDYFSEFDLIVSYLFDPDGIFQTNVGRCCHGQFIAATHRPNEGEKIHAGKVYLKPLERLTIFDADPVPRINLAGTRSTASLTSQAETEDGDAVERVPTVALHPGSGSEKKNWPEANWADLLRALVNSTALNLLLVGGEAEGERLRNLVAAVPTARIAVAQSLPLVELAVRLQPCIAFVGHDSGITHLAAALGLPTLVLWADSVEEIWRPQGESVVIVKESTGLDALSVERVATELAQMLPV
ncbi:MAG: glycosyltransferase family 9 protein [Verrucomicrobia bacterium]|jgi:heptosyltransferase-2|nr:glycosyltransferase family 9 protein [Verrucomicrobiota bacterium]